MLVCSDMTMANGYKVCRLEGKMEVVQNLCVPLAIRKDDALWGRYRKVESRDAKRFRTELL